jgi:hypothetical protein
MQVTYRPHKRACRPTFYFSSLFDNAHNVLHFDAFANKLLSNVRLKCFSAYVHIDVVVKSSELSNMHADVKFYFISLFGVAAQKLDMKRMCIKTSIRVYAIN